MGRTVEEIQIFVNVIANRWKKTSRAMLGLNRIYAERVIQKMTANSETTFSGLTDPLEAAVFSVLIEMERDLEEMRANQG